MSKDIPPKPVLNPEEARLLYVAATRARKLLVVPPRLAEKWNIPPAPTAAPVAVPPPIVTPARPVNPRPPLPSFARVITLPPAASSFIPTPGESAVTPQPGLLSSLSSFL